MELLSYVSRFIKSNTLMWIFRIAAGGILSSIAYSNIAATNAQWLPPIGPRFAPTGMTGDYSTGEGDLLLPTYGDDNDFVFTDLDGKYGNSGDTSYGSAGLGYRGIHADRIFGGYVFGDRNVSLNRNIFWVINPGIESLGRTWDIRINGYIPLEQVQNVGAAAPGESFGTTEFVTFEDHSQFDEILQPFESTGYGGDAEIGRKVPFLPQARAFVGGYYFDQKDADSITGFAGRVEYALNNHATLLAADTYDNLQHNVFEVGLRICFDYTTKDDDELYRRLLTPVVRHLANLKNGNGIPISEGTKQLGSTLVQSNIYFFTPNGDTSATAPCTFEHPCNGNTFATWLNTNSVLIPSGSNFYFSQGTTYPALNSAGTGALTIPNTFSVWGRSGDFKASETVPFEGSFILGSNTALHYIALFNNPALAFQNGVQITNSSNVLLDSIQVGTPGGLGNGSDFFRGVSASGASNLMIDASNINGFSTTTANPVGLNADNLSTITVNGSTISSTGNGPFGIFILHNSVVAVNNSQVSAQNTTVNSAFSQAIRLLTGTISVNSSQISATSTVAMSDMVEGIAALTSSTVNVNDSSIFASTSANGGSLGAAAIAGNASNNIINVSGSVLTAIGNNTSDGPIVYGILGLGGAINVTNTDIFATLNQSGGTAGDAIGINQGNNSTLNVSNTSITANANGSGATTVNAFGIRSVSNDVAVVTNVVIRANAFTSAANTNAYSYGIFASGGGRLTVLDTRVDSQAQGVLASGAAGIDTSGVLFDSVSGTSTPSTITSSVLSATAHGATTNTAYALWDNVLNPAVLTEVGLFASGDPTRTCRHFIQNGGVGICLD